MKVEDFRDVIKRREYVEEISSGEWAEGIEECWKKEIDLLSEDIPSTCHFLNTECSAEEFSWISEVIENVLVETHSREIFDSFSALMDKFPEECERYHIREMMQDIRY